jgi:hypothetical protein
VIAVKSLTTCASGDARLLDSDLDHRTALQSQIPVIQQQWDFLVAEGVSMRASFNGPDVVRRINMAIEAFDSAADDIEQLNGYMTTAKQVRDALENGCRYLEAVNDQVQTSSARLAKVGEAKVIVQPSETDLVEEANQQWPAIVFRYSDLMRTVPGIPSELAIDSILE